MISVVPQIEDQMKYTYDQLINNPDKRESFFRDFERLVALLKRHGFYDQVIAYKRYAVELRAEIELISD
jgi:hypothetical protein